jgi:hypothetical protein
LGRARPGRDRAPLPDGVFHLHAASDPVTGREAIRGTLAEPLELKAKHTFVDSVTLLRQLAIPQ